MLCYRSSISSNLYFYKRLLYQRLSAELLLLLFCQMKINLFLLDFRGLNIGLAFDQLGTKFFLSKWFIFFFSLYNQSYYKWHFSRYFKAWIISSKGFNRTTCILNKQKKILWTHWKYCKSLFVRLCEVWHRFINELELLQFKFT